MSSTSIWLIDRNLAGATTPDQRGPRNGGNKRLLRISQSSSITGASLSDCLVSYPGHLLKESYSSVVMQSVYSAARGDWDKIILTQLCTLYHMKLRWRCPWCNGYRRRKWTRRHEFKSWTRLIAFHIVLIPLGKVWIQLSLPPAMGK